MNDAIASNLDLQILDTHERFSKAMEERLPRMNAEQKERYFVMISKFVGNLEQREKPLKQVLQESMGELLPLVMQELAS